MLFNSLDFLLFFPIVLLLYYVLPKKIRYIWLLISSYYFYMCWNATYILLILASTIITYSSGILLEKIKYANLDDAKRLIYKKATVALSLILNLGILFYFKYTNFALLYLARMFSAIHIQLNIPTFDIILPVGISFYTFQALSYTIDVYRDEIYAEKNFFRYALFVSFFPQLVAGPIERSKNLLKQLRLTPDFSFERARFGFVLMLWGYFLKIVVADRVAVFVDKVYGGFENYPGFYLIFATILFAFQIYCDFAGYSTIAMGTARILGIELMENFDAPYTSMSVSEFWRRWHISLSSWFKDYLYIPLGGNRKGKARKYINKVAVFLVSGLWHGSDLSYVVWGGLNGLYQVVGEVLQPLRDKVNAAFRVRQSSVFYKIYRIIGTFILVDFSWIFFRADCLSNAFKIIRSIFTTWNPNILFDGSLYYCGLDDKNFWLMIVSLFVLIFADLCKRVRVDIIDVILRQKCLVRWVAITMSIITILIFGIWGPEYDSTKFIYFMF